MVVERVQPKSHDDREPDTQQRILDAAEQLFVEHGFAATSMRMIAAQAQVNIAAANYHFGSKDALYQAVFIRRLAPLNHLCLSHLDALEHAAAGQPLPVADIAGAFVRAAATMSQCPDMGGVMFVRLLSRTFVELHPALKEVLTVEYAQLVRRYFAAFAQAMPQVDRQSLLWRLHFAFTMIFNAFAGNDVLRLFTSGDGVNARDPELVAREVLPFVVAGLQA
jgi:AcrR family transcriptional regulator